MIVIPNRLRKHSESIELPYTTTAMWVTPEIARYYLAHMYPRQRKLRQRDVDKLKRILHQGEWQTLPDGFKFTPTGLMFDGQHRCEAIAQSGISAVVNIHQNCPEKMFDHIDRGKKRSLGDSIGSDQATLLSTLVRIIMGRHEQLTPEDADFVLSLYGKSTQPFLNARSHRKGFGRMGVLAPLVLCHNVYGQKAVDFYTDFVTGADLTLYNPALRLRNKVFDTLNSGKLVTGDELRETAPLANATVQCCVAYCHGWEIQQIRPACSNSLQRVLEAQSQQVRGIIAHFSYDQKHA